MDSKKYVCKICNKSFDKFQQNANHYRWIHKENKFSDAGLQSIKDKKKIYDDNLYGIIVKDIVKCNICQKDIDISYREKKGKKSKYFCSRSCANTRHHSDQTKQQISKTLSETLKYKWDTDVEYRNKLLKQTKIFFNSKSERELVKYFKEVFKDDEWTCGGGLKSDNITFSRDLYSNKLKVCIEVDGIWHFKDIHGQLLNKQLKDKLLNEWCKKNGWKIIRIKEEFLSSKDKFLWYEKIINAVYNINEQYIEYY